MSLPEVPLEAAEVDPAGAIGEVRGQDVLQAEGHLAPELLDLLHVGDVDPIEELPGRLVGLLGTRQGLAVPPVGLPREVR